MSKVGKEVDSPKDEDTSGPDLAAALKSAKSGAKRARRSPPVPQETAKMSAFQLEEALERLRIGSAPAVDDEDVHQRRTISGEQPVVRPPDATNTSAAAPAYTPPLADEGQEDQAGRLAIVERPVEAANVVNATISRTAQPDAAEVVLARVADAAPDESEEEAKEDVPNVDEPLDEEAAITAAPGSAVGLILLLVAAAALIAAIVFALEPRG